MFNKKIFSVIAVAVLFSACQSKTSNNNLVSDNNAPSDTGMQYRAAKLADSTVFFEYNSDKLSNKGKEILDSQAKWLKDNSDARITVEGHCDQRGSKEFNYTLGKKRAVAAKKYLTEQGVNSSKIRVVTYGKDRPAVQGEGEEVWSKNRRAIIVK
jgi:peptidoglycan-associated lipoprotein